MVTLSVLISLRITSYVKGVSHRSGSPGHTWFGQTSLDQSSGEDCIPQRRLIVGPECRALATIEGIEVNVTPRSGWIARFSRWATDLTLVLRSLLSLTKDLSKESAASLSLAFARMPLM